MPSTSLAVVGQYVHLPVAMTMVATGMTTKVALVHIDRSTQMALVHTGRSGVRNLSIAAHRSTYVLIRTWASTLTSELLLLVLLLLMMLLLLLLLLLLILLLTSKDTWHMLLHLHLLV
jgi:hypothetical protein